MKDTILLTGAKGFIGSHIKGARQFQGFIDDSSTVEKQVWGMEGIVHLAAKSNRHICEEDIAGCLFSNVIGMYNILEAALAHKLWVLFISTYQVKENHLYGLSKLIGEELCRLYKKRGVNVHIIRLPIVYGPGDKLNKIVLKFIRQIKTGKTPKVKTNEKFNFLFVEDAVKIIEHQVNVIQGIYGPKYSLCDLISGIRECIRKESHGKR